jgi:hypothetical protein
MHLAIILTHPAGSLRSLPKNIIALLLKTRLQDLLPIVASDPVF